MSYLSRTALEALGFQHLGHDVLISDRASIYEPERISIGDHSRIDDFCVLAGAITIGRNVHLTVFNNVEGGRAGISIGDFATIAYGCHLIAQSDDYSGRTMTNSTIPGEFKLEKSEAVVVGDHSILGAGTIVLPGVKIGVGTASGANTLFLHDAEAWTIYVGSPARKLRDRDRSLLGLADAYLASEPEP